MAPHEELGQAMTSRMLNWTEYSQQYDAEGRLITVTQGANTTVFTYDGDGNRVKQVVDGVTTVFVNGWYEVQIGTPDQATTYYLFGGKRIAVRVDDGDPIFLHGDHLGGTAATTRGGRSLSTSWCPHRETGIDHTTQWSSSWNTLHDYSSVHRVWGAESSLGCLDVDRPGRLARRSSNGKKDPIPLPLWRRSHWRRYNVAEFG